MTKPKNPDIIVCEKCKGIYRLKDGESLDDFESCKCGGTLKHASVWDMQKKDFFAAEELSSSNTENQRFSSELKYAESKKETKKNKNTKILPIIAALIIISGFAAYACDLEGVLFDMIPYNYTSDVWIPPNSASSGSLAGYYNIQGQGRDFNLLIKLPGAEKAESPLDYTKEGLNGIGRINHIEITYNTIQALLSGDFKKAMFETKFSGNLNMTCAAWTGSGTFSSESENVNGTFKIDGAMTDWDGTFKIINQNNRLVLRMDYIYYPNGQKDKAKSSYDIIYM